MAINPIYPNPVMPEHFIANILNDTYGQVIKKALGPFDGTAGNGLSASPIATFTTTGVVLVKYIFGICNTTCTQSGATPTLALGVTGQTTLFIAATTATNITSTNSIWMSATPTAAGLLVPAGLKDNIITANVIGTVGGTNNINGGQIDVYAIFQPMSAGAGLS